MVGEAEAHVEIETTAASNTDAALENDAAVSTVDTTNSVPQEKEAGDQTRNSDGDVELTTSKGEDATKPSLLEIELEKANTMKVGELKLKLTAMGILTHSFCEKSEFIRAYAEAKVKQANNNTSRDKIAVLVEDVNDDDEDDGNCIDNNVGDESLIHEEDDDEVDDDPMSEMPPYVQQRVLKVKGLHEQREALMNEYLKERAQLEAKYQSLCKPLYDKRREIVCGERDEEIAKEGFEKQQSEQEPEKSTEEDAYVEEKETRVVGIPQFWVCALGHMEVVAELITEKDVACLEYLQDVACIDDENGEGFTLCFHFSQNEYFENDMLTKRYEVPNLLLADEPILKDVQGCTIQWKPGKCLTETKITKKQRGKGRNAGQVRSVTSTVRCDSFFNFFQPPTMPSLDQMNDEVAVKLEHAFDQDYDIAQAFRSHIIPKAVLWFTGQAMEKEMEEAMKGMEGMEWPEGNGQVATGDNDNPECKQS